jgi:hypothetical protein
VGGGAIFFSPQKLLDKLNKKRRKREKFAE